MRASSLEPWSKLATDGQAVVSASTQGAVARRASNGTWTVERVLDGEITALALSKSGLWVAATGIGLAQFDGTSWHDAGPGPSPLTRFEALALDEAQHVYVGGTDATGVARVFRRER